MNVAVADFVERWLGFEPEGRLLGNFLGPVQRETYLLASALQFALEDAALRIAEPTVAAAKLAWWQDELARTGRHAARHPLTLALAERAPGASFGALAAPLAALSRHESSSNGAALDCAIAAWTTALAGLAAALHGGELKDWPVESFGRGFQLRRLRELDAQVALGRLWIPLDLMAAERIARHQLGAAADGEHLVRARRSMARRLLVVRARQPMHRIAAMQDTLQQLRLEHMARTGADRLPPLRALWRTWRAARA